MKKFLDISNVVNIDWDESQPMLQFKDSDGVIWNICNVAGLEDGLEKIKQIFKDSNFKEDNYTRINIYPTYHEVDYGLHNGFFIVAL